MVTIYCILNRNNGKRYVGQTIDHRRRMRTHRNMLAKGCHRNPRMQKDHNLGHDFYFIKIEECENAVNLKREAHYMGVFKTLNKETGYNEVNGESKHSESMKEKMKANNYNKGRTGENHYLFGKKLSAEHRAKLGKPGEKNPASKLTDVQREEICKLYAAGNSQKTIAPLYGVSQSQISRIVIKWGRQ